MPLPTDEKVLENSTDLVKILQEVFGRYPGVRPSHAKGIFVTGTFSPSDTAKVLSIAPHFNNPSTPVIARFSLFTGLPDLADTDPRASPHGLAVRFMLAETPHRVHTDIISHASPLFPGSTGEEVLAFFQSLRDNSVNDYMLSHPAAAAFVQEHRPIPRSFAHESFYSVNAFKLIDKHGQSTSVRYRWIPLAGQEHLNEQELQSKRHSFLFDELPGLLKRCPIILKLIAQVAEDGDVTDDCTNVWPEERNLVELGTLVLDSIMAANQAPPQAEAIIFDPIPKVEGVEPSADPILNTRAGVYLISGQARRDTAS